MSDALALLRGAVESIAQALEHDSAALADFEAGHSFFAVTKNAIGLYRVEDWPLPPPSPPHTPN